MISRTQVKALTLLLAIVALGLSAVACNRSKAEANKNVTTTTTTTQTVVEVTTTPAIQRQLPRFLEATGSLAADEQTDVAPATSGKVVSVGIDLGTFVQKGAVLVRLDDRDSRIRLDQATAQVAQAQSQVRQAEARIGLRPGQSFDVERVAEVSAARVALNLAEIQLRRMERLLESGDVSRSAYDQQRAQRDQLREQLEAIRTQARQNYAGIQTARAAVDAAQSQVASARKAIADAVVTAPIAGFVSDRPADVGEYVTPSSKIATIVRTNPLRMRIDIPEQAVSNVQVGQSVSVTVSTYPDRTFSGRVHHISPSVTPNSRTLTVEAEVDNGDNLLKPGQFATVRVLLPQSEAAVLVPARSVKTEAGTSRIFVIKDGIAQQRLVQLGQAEGDLVEIRSGVAADEIVATSNVELLNDGMPVRQ
ncbi:MAG TPA: efflux RND transporter periplasmic adaptor subunit [Pyrinomonadaceae bacterium]|nr:efflux RND transporter periplasmic adaptor subunit [Pyrinomonadaceae bacterium]